MKIEDLPDAGTEPAWGSVTVSERASLRPEYPKVICILPAYNEAKNLVRIVPMLDETLRPITREYSIIVVDDGSADETSAVAVALSSRYPVRLVQLSRNFGKESAITAGLDHVDEDADATILMDSDCQHPVELLPEFLKHWREGYDMVYGVINDRSAESAARRRAVQWFYTLLSTTASTPIVPNAGDFRLFDKQVIAALNVLEERGRFMKGLYAWVGFKSKELLYQPAPRHAGHSYFTPTRLIQLAVTGITSFTDIPLRIWGGIGAGISLTSISYGIYIAARTFIHGIDVPGWATLTVAMTFLGGLQLLSIGIIGEYIGHIFTEVKGRPVYLVRRRHGFKDDTGKP